MTDARRIEGGPAKLAWRQANLKGVGRRKIVNICRIKCYLLLFSLHPIEFYCISSLWARWNILIDYNLAFSIDFVFFIYTRHRADSYATNNNLHEKNTQSIKFVDFYVSSSMLVATV